MDLEADEARRRFCASRVARLATVDAAGRPHLVPVTFAVAHDVVVTAVDHKPKRTMHLKRLANLRVNPHVSLLVDAYGEDWDGLWWVRADGEAEVVTAEPDREVAVAQLALKYVQYRHRAPAGPAILIRVHQWRGWSAG